MATERTTVRVLAFARIRELLGFSERTIDVPAGSTLEALWETFAAGHPEIASLRASTRFARNGTVAAGESRVVNGDEIALLPPVGGG